MKSPATTTGAAMSTKPMATTAVSPRKNAGVQASSIRQSVPSQEHNTPLPLKRAPPASFKRLLGRSLPQPYHLTQSRGRVRAHPKPAAARKLKLHGFPAPNVVQPPVRREVNAPAVPPRVRHRRPSPNFRQQEGTLDEAGPKPKREALVIDVRGEGAKKDHRKCADA